MELFSVVRNSGVVVPQGILYPPNYNGSIPVPYVGPTVPVPAALPKMFYVWVTTLIADTAAWAYQEAGVSLSLSV